MFEDSSDIDASDYLRRVHPPWPPPGAHSARAFSYSLEPRRGALWSMHPNTTVIERAFELAKSGQYVSVEEIKRRLHAEGYFAGQVQGRELGAQLKAAIDTARKAKSEG